MRMCGPPWSVNDDDHSEAGDNACDNAYNEDQDEGHDEGQSWSQLDNRIMNNMRITMIITTTCIIVLLVVVHSGCSSQVLMDQKSMVSQSQSCHIKMIQYILTSPPTPLCPLYWKKCNWWCVRETKFILKKYRGFGIMFWTRPSFIGRLRGDAEGDLNEGHLRFCISRDDIRGRQFSRSD